jgi:hypothetical protein
MALTVTKDSDCEVAMLLQTLPRSEKIAHAGMEPETPGVVRYLCDGELVHSRRLSPEGVWARVWNISVGGIGQPQGAHIEPDTELVVQMKPAEPDMPLALVARVAQAIRQPKGDWLVRCDSLRRATEADLFARSEVPGPTRPPHSPSQTRRVLLACYGLHPSRSAVFSN